MPRKYIDILAGSTTPGKDWGYLPYVFISIGNIIWPVSWIYANEHKMNNAQTFLIRGITLIIANYIMCRLYGTPIDLKNPTHFRYLVLRASMMTIHSFFFALSMFILPLPIVHTVNCTGTLFIFLIDYFLNHVKINYQQSVGIFIGIIGAMLTTNGKLISHYFFTDTETKTDFHYITNDPIIMTFFSFLFLAGVACWALGIVITKRAHSNTFLINYTLGIAFMIYGGLSYPFFENKCTKMDLFISIFALGIPLIIGQWFYIGSLTMTKNTGVLNMMNFVTIIIGYLFSIFRYH